MTDPSPLDAIDPVCGMTVKPQVARDAGFSLEHDGVPYHFCGKGCLLEFRENPEIYLDPSYAPSM